MIGLALDNNDDIFIKNGEFQLVTEGSEVVQHVRSRLLFYLGEWFLDTTAGVPYFQEIFTKPANLANVESLLKRQILLTPEVLVLIDFKMAFDSITRKLNVTFTAETTYGVIDVTEVTINA